MSEKGSMIAEIGDCARDGISYTQFGSESVVRFWEFIFNYLAQARHLCY